MELKASLEKKFSSPEEEIVFLREHIKKSSEGAPKISLESHAKAVLENYKDLSDEKILNPRYQIPLKEQEGIVLNLLPEAHDKKMEELLSILLERGVKNALSLLEEIKDPHLDDDFHRFLVQYLVSQGSVPGLNLTDEKFKGVSMGLYRISVPKTEVTDLKEFISRMEQFYAGMLSIADGKRIEPGKNYFTLELALPEKSSELALYAAVPRSKASIFEKQFLAFYPDARIAEETNDYNVFVENGASMGARAELIASGVFPIKTYEQFDHDPMDALLSAFSKIRTEGEGAALQLLVAPAGDHFIKLFGLTVENIDKGMPLKEAMPAKGMLDAFAKVGKGFVFGVKRKEGDGKDAHTLEAKTRIKEKLGSTIVYSGLRIVVSAGNVARAKEILGEITSAFNQLRSAEGNGLTFELCEGRSALAMFHEFSYRIFKEDESFPLNLKELATVFHTPHQAGGSAHLLESSWKTAKAPINISQSGVVLGINRHQSVTTEVHFAPEDRMRHFYVIGQTGTGKTTLLKQMVIQDIAEGRGVCMIDPHGNDLEEVLAHIPESRADDLIYFDPGYVERPMGLNMLEYDSRFPEQKTFVVNELLSIFNKLFDMKVAGGPAFEQYFRNAAFAVMDYPESGNTLLDIARVLSDREFRAEKLAHSKNPLVTQFWQNAERTTGDQGLANFVPYITNKFDVFLSNDIMRPIIAQERSAWNFRDIMDQKKIFLVNLSKGRLGDVNSNLLGLIIVGKLLMAALSRTDLLSLGQKPSDFYLYIDEFQNVTTDSIATIFSEARKYRLSLTVANQYIAQLEERIKQSVFGNVGSMAVFRVGQEDAEFLEKQFLPTITAKDIASLSNRNAYVKLLVNGEPTTPFNIETITPEPGDLARAKQMRDMSRARYGVPREKVEKAILEKYKKKTALNNHHVNT
ncbi:MAG: TraM recognition domain-containing protein [Patescibacteria group bacterium]